ncbi:MAG: long-chain-fatty-acid--CoA ligase [SAR324 cluster bacterium]|nr:long-chain-fatty-acid--CoA ligase [SAR324 cluster bacterium]
MYITQGLKNAMQMNGSRVATVDGTRRYTWSELGSRISKLAGAFKNLGLSERGRVAILALNSDCYLQYYYAVPWAGAIMVPLNIRLSPPELIFMLNDSETEILLVDDTFVGMLADFEGKLESVKEIIHITDQEKPADGTHHFEKILNAADAIPDAASDSDDVAGLFYTGGTTGLPKGVMLTNHNLVFNNLNTLMMFDYSSDSVYLHAAPMFHAADICSTGSITMVQGLHVFMPRFEPEAMLKVFEAEKVTHTLIVPTMINMTVNHPLIRNYDLSHLQKIIYGASPMPEEVIRKAMVEIPHCTFNQAYGMTELSPLATILPSKFHTLDGPNSKIKSAGRAIPSIEVKIVDEDGREVPRGVVGEVIVKGDNVMKGYWKRPEETANAIREGWMHSQDAGYMDEDGFVYISDRLKDMIISGGENIYSVEIENVIYQHPAVASCAVVGIPDEQWGEVVHAIVVLKEGSNAEEKEIIDFCTGKLGGFKIPRNVEFRGEPLPLSGAGKILKNKLREPFWKGREKRIH